MKKTKIALFFHGLRGYGLGKVLTNLAHGFVERGIEVDFVVGKVEDYMLNRVPKGSKIINMNVNKMINSLPKLIHYLKREKPDILLSSLDRENVIALLAWQLARVDTQVLISVHSNTSQVIAHAKSLRVRLLRPVTRHIYPWAKTVIAVSQGVADDLILRTRIPQEKVKVIYNPVVTPELFLKAEEPLNHPWFEPDEPPVILGVGRLSYEKDFGTLIRAFSFVRRETPVRLVILGEGGDRPKLEALVRELGLENDVALPGFAENPYKYMKRANVVVLSSVYEGLGNVLIEALALGTPVVSTDCPSGPSEILENGKWGTLVPVRDVVALGQAILKALQQKEAPSGAKERMIELFGLDRVVDQYLEVFGLR